MHLLRSFAIVAAATTAAYADTWVVAEAPAAFPVSDAQAGVFRPGVMPALGVYTERGVMALGARLRAGVLRNGPAPGNNLTDPGVGGLATGELAVRGAFLGGWLEAAAGGGVTGHDFAPVAELGAGWDFTSGSLDFGPSVRYVRVVASKSMEGFGSADLLLFGVDVRFGREHAVRVVPPPPPPPAAPPPPPPEPAPSFESDHDRVLDGDVSCAIAPDGCPVIEGVEFHDDRIVLDERVLFDTNFARVKSSGREVIKAIAAMWQAHPEWKHLTIEGHTDVRGGDDLNQELSEHRADRVRDVFVKYGVDPDKLSTVGYGRTRPRDDGTSAEAHQRNRRVEFLIDRGVQ